MVSDRTMEIEEGKQFELKEEMQTQVSTGEDGGWRMVRGGGGRSKGKGKILIRNLPAVLMNPKRKLRVWITCRVKTWQENNKSRCKKEGRGDEIGSEKADRQSEI